MKKSKNGSIRGSPQKTHHFIRDGIRKLSERWEKVVINDGQYFD